VNTGRLIRVYSLFIKIYVLRRFSEDLTERVYIFIQYLIEVFTSLV